MSEIEGMLPQYAMSEAWKEAYDNLAKAIKRLEAIQGGEIKAIAITEEGLFIQAAFDPDEVQQFEVMAGFRPKN